MSATRRHNKSRRSALRIEQLDDRITPASNITIVSGPHGTGSLDGVFISKNGVLAETDGANGGNNAETLSTGSLIVNLAATNNVSITARNSIALGNLTLNFGQAAGKSITFRALLGDVASSSPTTSSVSTNGATILFQADGVIRPGELRSNGGTIDLKAKNIDLGRPVNAGAGSVFLAAPAAATTIDIGGADATNKMGLSDAELDQITAGLVTIGDTGYAGAMTVSAPITAPAGFHTLSLKTAGGISQSGTGSLGVGSLAVRAGGAVSLGSNANAVSTVAAATTADAFTFKSTDNLTAGPVDGVLGIATAGGAIDVTAGTAHILSVFNPIDAGNAAVTLRANDLGINTTITSGTQALTLTPTVASRAIVLGGGPAGEFSVSDAELGRLTAGVLRVGSAAHAATIFAHNITPHAGYNTLALETTGAVQWSAGTIAVDHLAVRAGGAVNLGAAAHPVKTLAAATTADAFTFKSAGNLTVGTVVGLSGIATAGGAVDLTAGGTLTVDQAIDAGNAAVILRATDMAINAAVKAGTQAVNLVGTSTTAQDVYLGGSSTGRLSLSDAELDKVTAGSLSVSAPGSLYLTQAVTAAGGGWTDLTLGAGGSIFFNGGSVATGGDVTLTANTTGGTRSDATGTDVTADALTVNAGTSGVGVAANPLRTDVASLTVNSATHVFVAEANTAAVPTRINASGGTVNLLGGTFAFGPGATATGSTTTVGSGATLSGPANVAGKLVVADNGTLAPGSPVGTVDVTGNVTFQAGANLPVHVNGSAAGAFDRITSGGLVDLGGATLSVNLGYTPAEGDSIVLLPVLGTGQATGTFDGLAEGAVVQVGSSVFHVTYQGGDGNDVALIANRAPTANVGGPYAIAQGAPLTLAGSGADADNDALSYKWDLNGDGATDVTGATAVVPWGQLEALGVGSIGDHPIRLTVSDGQGLFATADAVLTVSNSAPAAYVSGPAVVVRGVAAEFTLGANDATSTEFTYAINWGDGTTETVEAGIGMRLVHAFAATGTYTVSVTVTDENGLTSPAAEAQVEVRAAALLAHPTDAGVMDLIVGGSPGKDTIVVDPADASGVLRVRINGAEVGAFQPTGRVVVDGLAGDDTLQVKSRAIQGKTVKVARPAIIDGGDGNDKLSASGVTSSAVLIGGAGNDKLTGGAGRDLLFGGVGKDGLSGGGGEDVLVGGGTVFDANRPALEALRAEWTRTDATYADRLAHLQTGGGLNGAFVLAGSALPADGAADGLTGGGGLDAFFATKIGTPKDSVKDKARTETRIDL